MQQETINDLMQKTMLRTIYLKARQGLGYAYFAGFVSNEIGLGIHKELITSQHREGQHWTITHLSSGYALCTLQTQEQAMKCIEELLKRFSGWTKTAKKLQANEKLPEIIECSMKWAVDEICI